MLTEKNRFTRLTIEQSDKKVTIEVPYEDVTSTDMIQMFETCMIGITFLPVTVYNSMKNRIEELSEFYEKDCEN